MSSKFNIFISGSRICTTSLLVWASMKIAKHFIVALIETICFNFRLDIGPTNLNDMDEFVPVTKHMNGTESKVQIHLVKKKFQKKTANCLLKLVSAIFYEFSSNDNPSRTMKNVFYFI